MSSNFRIARMRTFVEFGLSLEALLLAAIFGKPRYTQPRSCLFTPLTVPGDDNVLQS
jgi:hypothetical protein